ncbi:metal-sulfur cluster assembly factor [Gemmatimonadota bacterium]
MVEKGKIIEFIKAVTDPEFDVDVYNLGLIYDIRIEGSKVKIQMTLTSLGCPTAPMIESDIKKAVSLVDGVEEVEVEWTFDPPWSPELMTDEARELFESMRYM